MTRLLRVFLCHSSNDKPTVRELYQKLRAETWIDPWLDEEKLYPGQDWNMEIEKAVEAADAIIVCLSKGSITKEGYVQRELRTVLDFADYKPEGTLYIIPVRLEECEPPRRLRTWQYADYFEGQRERAFQRLLVSLNIRADALGLMTEELERKQIEEQGKREAEGRISTPKTPKPEVRKSEERVVSAPVTEELIEELKKEIPVKPFTKLLDPSSLSSKEGLHPQISGQDGALSTEVISKRVQKPSPSKSLLWFGVSGVIFLGLLFVLFGRDYIFNNNKLPATEISIPETDAPMISEKDDMTLVYVPSGEFIMGGYDTDDEKPVHAVNLDSFWIDQNEVSNYMYEKCVSEGKCNPPNDDYYFGNSNYANYPIVQVSWNDAVTYCSWANRRLPTEAEWEKAARGPSGNPYPWGSELPTKGLLNYNKNIGAAVEIRTYPAGESFYGAYDMAGNVWEWVSTLYKPYPYDPDDGRENMETSAGTRVFRGGSWKDADIYVRSANRGLDFPTVTSLTVGFRCAVSP